MPALPPPAIEPLSSLAAYLLLGAGAGYIGGLLGLGGGIVIVPALYLLFQAQGVEPALIMHLAVGTSLASVIFTAVSSARAHARRGAVRWPIFAALVPGILLGAFTGAAIADLLPAAYLRALFGVFELFVAAQLMFRFEPQRARHLPGAVATACVGVVIGVLSTLLGIGGGVFTVLFLLWAGVPILQAVGTAAACGLPIALAGSTGMMLTGWGQAGLPPYSAGYVYLPAMAGIVAASVLTAPLGAATAHALPVHTLRRIFAGVLALVGVRMLL